MYTNLCTFEHIHTVRCIHVRKQGALQNFYVYLTFHKYLAGRRPSKRTRDVSIQSERQVNVIWKWMNGICKWVNDICKEVNNIFKKWSMQGINSTFKWMNDIQVDEHYIEVNNRDMEVGKRNMQVGERTVSVWTFNRMIVHTASMSTNKLKFFKR